MPSLPPRPCTRPGCRELVALDRPCPTHGKNPRDENERAGAVLPFKPMAKNVRETPARRTVVPGLFEKRQAHACDTYRSRRADRSRWRSLGRKESSEFV